MALLDDAGDFGVAEGFRVLAGRRVGLFPDEPLPADLQGGVPGMPHWAARISIAETDTPKTTKTTASTEAFLKTIIDFSPNLNLCSSDLN